LDHTQHNFGVVARGAKAEHVFVLRNPAAEAIHIAGIRSSCGCARVRVLDDKRTIPPGDSASVIASLDTSSFAGARSATIGITLDKPAPGEVQAHVETYVRSDVLVQPGNIEFGAIQRGGALEKTIRVSSSGRYSWGIVEVKSGPYFTCHVAQTHRDWNQVCYELRVRLDSATPPGYLREHLIVVTNEPQHREIRVPVEAHVLADVSVSPATLFLGVVQPGEEVLRQLVVRAKKPFVIKNVLAEGAGLEIGLVENEESKPLHLIPVRLEAGERPGKLQQTIRIETSLQSGTISVPASVVVAPRQGQFARNRSRSEVGVVPLPQLARPLASRLPVLKRLLGDE